ncbi:hypothetical protein ACX9MO_02815 [Pseudooceanicola sp. 502str34]|jgi:hypothetical protein|uniref:hypothetical protein n=1 Tax=Maritimibacter alkaliphilus TaxID=404236 RepID=UPI001C97C111|nr:hypothetical protein [Maritimibacter alkaliphilus]MBY6091575.1 hypothetical protein [Maritimibacter alkaliphilus]
MQTLIWGGAALSLVGLVGLVWAIVQVSRARRAGLDDEALREVIRKVIPLNLGSLLLSVLGLAVVIAGILLG